MTVCSLEQTKPPHHRSSPLPSYSAVTRERYSHKRWTRYNTYKFTANSAIVPIVASEAPKAVMVFPLALTREGEGYGLSAVLSFQPNQNLFVTHDGRWIGSYIPSRFRSYPFAMLPTETGEQVLCIDEESGLVTDEDIGERFFDADGAVAEATRKIVEFLTIVQRDREKTLLACKALSDSGVVVPWDITVKAAEGERRIEGLFKVDETALNALSVEAFELLRQSGALPIAYCQMLSMQHLAGLGKLAEAHAARRSQDEKLMKTVFSPPETGEFDIDWNSFVSKSEDD